MRGLPFMDGQPLFCPYRVCSHLSESEMVFMTPPRLRENNVMGCWQNEKQSRKDKINRYFFETETA